MSQFPTPQPAPVDPLAPQPAAAAQPQFLQQPAAQPQFQQQPAAQPAPPMPAERKAWRIGQGKEGKQITMLMPAFRLSYPNLTETAKYQGVDTGKYQFEALYPEGSDITDFWDAVDWVGQQKWGPNWRNVAEGHAIRHARSKIDKQTGTPKPGYDHGGFICTPKSNRVVPQLIRQKDPATGKWRSATGSDIYPGCWCIAGVNIYPYTMGKMGVSLGLQHVMKWEDGEPFGVTANPEEDFAAIPEEVVTAGDTGFLDQPQPGMQPAAPLEDDIPF